MTSPPRKAIPSCPPPPSDLALIATIPEHLTRQRTIMYDVGKYDFREAIRAVVAPDHGVESLENLHMSSETVERYEGRPVNNHTGRTSFSKRWRARDQASGSTPLQGAAFRELLGRFAEEVLAPLLWEGEDKVGGVVYQREPTFRCHMPGDKANGARHRDYVYKRQPTEINCWLPITGPISATNGLYAESSPGAGDFTPFSCPGNGSAVMFWGNQCEHYSTPNETSVTRLSIDFRVIREDLFVEEYRAPWLKSSDDEIRFKRGQGYTDLDEERAWRATRQDSK